MSHLSNYGEALAMLEASRRGYPVFRSMFSYPKYDFVVERNGNLEKIQVKTVTPVNGKLKVPVKTMSYKKGTGRNNRTKMTKYIKGDFDWLIAVDPKAQKCYFLPADKVIGNSEFILRLVPPRNNQTKNVNFAANYKQW